MVEIKVSYENHLRCRATHTPSGVTLVTDAPKDNMGKGESFSPTDLVATALGTCMLTIMGILAERHKIDITGSVVRVRKEMSTEGIRRIARLPVEIHVPRELPEVDRLRMENGVMTCPVHKSLHPDIESPVKFRWGK